MEIYHREQEFSVLESLDGGDVNAFKSLGQAQGCENLAMPKHSDEHFLHIIRKHLVSNSLSLQLLKKEKLHINHTLSY